MYSGGPGSTRVVLITEAPEDYLSRKNQTWWVSIGAHRLAAGTGCNPRLTRPGDRADDLAQDLLGRFRIDHSSGTNKYNDLGTGRTSGHREE
jgi:hypothetical protein